MRYFENRIRQVRCPRHLSRSNLKICIYVYMCVCVCVCVCVNKYSAMCVYLYTYTYIYIHIYVCAYICIYYLLVYVILVTCVRGRARTGDTRHRREYRRGEASLLTTKSSLWSSGLLCALLV